MSQLPLRASLDVHVLQLWPEQKAAAGTTPHLPPTLLPQRPELLPRFAAYYTQLHALPRRVRRALQRKWKQSLAGMALLLALGQEPALAATINVTGGCSLINAITAANTDTATGGCPKGSGADTIRLPVGSTQTLTTINNSTYGPTGLPVISSVITIEGRNSTIRRASSDPDLFRIFAINGTGNLTLKDTTITGGVASGGNFPATIGGGIFNHEGTVILEGSTVSGNSADFDGGGVFNGIYVISYSMSTMTLTNSTVAGNTAGSGGGVANWGRVAVTLTNSTVVGNTTGGEGGGMFNAAFSSGESVVVTLTNSTVTGNTAGSGGGVSNLADSGDIVVTLTNSTLSGNTADYYGGGVANTAFSGRQRSVVVTLTNSTLSDNTAGGGGGGVANAAFSSEGSIAVTLTRSLISGNTASSGAEVYSEAGGVTANAFNLFGHDGDAGVEGFTPGPTDIVPTVPLTAILDPILDDNGGPTLTHALVSGSPAVDAVATGCPPPATDQRGFLRPADGDTTPGALCDIGSFELDALPPVVNDLVTFVPLTSTYRTTTNTSGCPAGFVGKFSFTARLTDKTTSPPLSDLTVEVKTLTNGNLLQNADDGPGGVGATLTVAEQGQFADGVLSPGELVDVPFVICLKQRGPFTFFVDVLGVEQE